MISHLHFLPPRLISGFIYSGAMFFRTFLCYLAGSLPAFVGFWADLSVFWWFFQRKRCVLCNVLQGVVWINRLVGRTIEHPSSAPTKHVRSTRVSAEGTGKSLQRTDKDLQGVCKTY